ncbi:hypothetical protein N8368_00350 [Bacteroidia bacterium]|nr:hypothetical protein [Bacteroidia bacterium]
MQKYILNIRLLVLLVFLYALGAQAQVLQWSQPTKLKGTAVFTKVIGENENGVFLLRYRNRFYTKSIILEKYTHLLVIEQGKAIDLRNARLIKLYMTAKGLLIIKSKYNRAQQTNELIAQWYDFNLKPVGPAKTVATAVPKEFGDRGSFRLRISDDHSFISLLYTELSENREIIVHHQLLDNELNAKYAKTVLLPYQYQNFVINDFLVTNNGETHIACKTYQKERKKIKSTTQRLFHFKDSTLNDFVITDSLSIKSSQLVYDRANDAAVVVALYGSTNRYGLLGTFFYRLNKDATEGSMQYGPFNESFMEKVKVNDRNDGAISEGYGIIKAIPRSDGGMMLITEQKEVATEDDVVLVNGIPQSTSKNIYNFNELLIINYDSAAFIDWHKVITKNQTTVNDAGYFSSAVVYVGDKYIQLLYNDQLRSSGDVMQYTIYNNGFEESSKLLKTELDFVAVIPSESKQVSSNKIIIPTSKNRRFALIKLVYN